MATRIKINTKDHDEAEYDTLVHFDRGRNAYTLCGLETQGDDGDGGVGIAEGERTSDKVDCPDCLSVVRCCRAIKRSECKE